MKWCLLAAVMFTSSLKFACEAKFSSFVKVANEICFESELMVSSAMKSVHPVFFHRISPLGQFSHRVAMSICLSVCLFVTSRKTRFRRLLRPLIKECIPNNDIGGEGGNFFYIIFLN